MIAPTARQLAIVAFWREFTDAHGYPPTMRDVMAAFGIQSTNAVTDHIRYCEIKGLLRRTKAKRGRGVVITPLGRSLTGAPPSARSPGLVVPEQKCACGASFFVVGQTRCSACVRAA